MFLQDHKHNPIVTDEAPHAAPSLVVCSLCLEVLDSAGAPVTNDELELTLELESLCDRVRWTCAWCHRIDMHGIAIFETLRNGSLPVMTGVICSQCQNKPIDIRTFG